VPLRKNGAATDTKPLAAPNLFVDLGGIPPDQITFTIATQCAVCRGLCADNPTASGV
jgi:hypothetical protein